MSILWPRLEPPIARARFEALQTSPPSAWPQTADLRHPAATFASTGGVRAGDSDLASLREAIVSTARNHGFPGRSESHIPFDREMAVALHDAMPMVDGEALVRSVWSHVALVVAPDVTHWRFVRNPGDRWNPERWVCTDRTRHMFARLWWQARQLTIVDGASRDTSLLDGLTESELNHLTERTTIGGYAPLVQELARAVIELPPNLRQRDLVRQAALLLLRRAGAVDPYSLSREQLRCLVADAIGAAGDL